MKYEDYTVDYHSHIGTLISSKNHITLEDLKGFLKKYNYSEIIIDDILKIWGYDKIKLSFVVQFKDDSENPMTLPSNEWLEFRPVLYLLLKYIGYWD